MTKYISSRSTSRTESTTAIILQRGPDTRSLVSTRGWAGTPDMLISRFWTMCEIAVWIYSSRKANITLCTEAFLSCSTCTLTSCELSSTFQILWMNVTTKLDQFSIYSCYFGEGWFTLEITRKITILRLQYNRVLSSIIVR